MKIDTKGLRPFIGLGAEKSLRLAISINRDNVLKKKPLGKQQNSTSFQWQEAALHQ